MEKNKSVAVKGNVGDQVIARVNQLCDVGFTMPKDYNYVNAIKMSLLKLQDVKDKNGRPALEVCSNNSVQTALYKMVTKGLNVALNQAYFIVKGDQLCLDESYFGRIAMVRRLYPDWTPRPVVIREGDEFEYGFDPDNGRKYVIKHIQKLENIDKGFVGAYMYLPSADGKGDLYMMTKKQIVTAWEQSPSRERAVHKKFEEKMIGKTLINSGCNIIINATPQYNSDDEPTQKEDIQDEPIEDFVDAEEVVDTEKTQEFVDYSEAPVDPRIEKSQEEDF